MTDLAELLERVKAATGPDRQLDLATAQALGLPWSYIGEPPRGIECPRFTASLDAALALVERVLPRWEFNLSVEYPDDQCGDAIWRMSLGDPLLGFDAEAPTPALAILAAALEALAYLQPAATQGDVGSSQLSERTK